MEKVAQQNEEKPAKCIRCGSDKHTIGECKVQWRRAWKGQPSARIGLKFKDGSAVEVDGWLTEQMAADLNKFILDMLSQDKPE